MLYILASAWNSHFQHFCCKKPKKARNLQQIWAKNSFFEFAPERWSTVLFPKKWAFSSILTSVWSAQHSNAGQNIKQICIILFFPCFSCFFASFSLFFFPQWARHIKEEKLVKTKISTRERDAKHLLFAGRNIQQSGSLTNSHYLVAVRRGECCLLPEK